MTLQTTGAISFSQIQSEFGGSDPISISEYYGRDILPNNGTIKTSDFYGRQAEREITISSNTTNLVLDEDYFITNASWNQTTGISVTIDSNIVISGSTTASPALTFPSGSYPSGLKLINNGTIVGDGGNGGIGGVSAVGSKTEPTDGGSGGTSLAVFSLIEVENYGVIAGGGGGGGGGAGSFYFDGQAAATIDGGGGGGGQSGLTNSSGGGTRNGSAGGQNGSPGTFNAPGAGGNGGSFIWSGGRGGDGGNWGAAGNNGAPSNGQGKTGIGAGGSGGPAVQGDSNITWISTGTRLGAIL